MTPRSWLYLSDFNLRLSLLSSRRLKVDEQAAINTKNAHVIPELLFLALA